MLLKTWQRWKNHTPARLLQGFRQQATWPTPLGGNNLDHVYLKGDMSIEIKKHQPFYCDHFENLNLLDEKKKILTRSLPEAILEQFCSVLFVILKCNSNSSFLINPYFHTFNCHLQVLIKQKEIQYLFFSFFFFYLFPGFLFLIFLITQGSQHFSKIRVRENQQNVFVMSVQSFSINLLFSTVGVHVKLSFVWFFPSFS